MDIGLVVLLAVGAGGLSLIWYLAQPPCPSCGARDRMRWRHQRVDGGPDRRYKDNRRLCGKCGWVE